ncbi:hypothetical protein QUC31_009134 [Theobroma cacao]
MVASSSAAKSAKTNNCKQTGSIAKRTYFKKRAEEPSAPAQRRAKQVVDERSRPKIEMMLEELSRKRAINQVTEVENQRRKDQMMRMENGIQELRGAVQELMVAEHALKTCGQGSGDDPMDVDTESSRPDIQYTEQELKSLEERMSELKSELYDLEKKRSEMCREFHRD